MAKQQNKNLSMVERSPKYKIIMEKYESIGVFMPLTKFHNDYVIKIDYNITMNMWYKFMAKYNRKIQIKTEELIARAADKKVTETQLEENSVKKLLAIADVTLDQVVGNPELLNSVPIADRMSWLFSAMKARDSRMIAVAKIQAEKRKTNLYEDVLKGAQYGAIKSEEIDDFEQPSQQAIEGDCKQIKNETDKPITIKTSAVEFSPQDLE